MINTKLLDPIWLIGEALQPIKEVVLGGRLIHLDVLAFHVEDDHGVARLGGFLDENLRGVCLTCADGTKDADVSWDNLLRLAVEKHGHVRVAGEATETEITRYADNLLH